MFYIFIEIKNPVKCDSVYLDPTLIMCLVTHSQDMCHDTASNCETLRKPCLGTKIGRLATNMHELDDSSKIYKL